MFGLMLKQAENFRECLYSRSFQAYRNFFYIVYVRLSLPQFNFSGESKKKVTFFGLKVFCGATEIKQSDMNAEKKNFCFQMHRFHVEIQIRHEKCSNTEKSQLQKVRSRKKKEKDGKQE